MSRLARVAVVWGSAAFGLLAGAGSLAAQTANAIVNVTLTPPPGDPGMGTLAANDDDSTNAEPLGIGGANGINFFGNNYTQVYVNNNGNLTFTGPLSQFTPNGLAMGVQCDNTTGDNCPIIAPFFADVDTSGTGSGLVMYGNATVNGFNAFIANYINVGYFSGETDKLNSFQVILLDRSDTGAGNFDIEFNYNNILWETGDASDGTDGLGGTSAAVGYSNGGTGANNIYFQLTGSLVNGALLNGGPDGLTTHSVNSTMPGRYIFPVRQGAITLLISNVTCMPGLLAQGGTSTCSVTLTGNAPAGAATSITLASSNAALSVPASVTVPAGQNTTTFTATAGNATSTQQATITASLGGISQTAMVTLSNAVQTGYIGVFYNSTPPSPCPAALTVLCTANTAANNKEGGVIDGPVFVFVNTSSTPITNAVFSVSDAASGIQDSFKVGTINPNSSFTLIPGVTDDGQNHGGSNFFTVTGTPLDTSDDGPSANTTRFTFTGQQGSTTIQSADVCGVPAPPTFTPACTLQPLSNDGNVSNINFLGGPGDNDGPCDNCFGPAIVALLISGGGGSGSATISISSTTLTSGTVSTAGSQTLTASGGTAPYTWKVLAGFLPPGTTFSSTGTLSGTPTRAGTYTFTVQVTDVNGNSAVRTLSITIAAPTLTITTPSPLPAGMATVQYPTQVLSATGGAAPYTFTLASGSSLPAGLMLAANGSISGTPTTAGTSRFTITATDSSQPAQTGTATFTLNVRPFSADLLISSGSLAFTLASGATALPPSQNVPVEATDPTKILNWSATITPAVSWLTLTGGKTGSTTPGAFHVALTAGASQLAASATPYSATVVVSCLAPSPCAGNTQNLTVTLLVSTVSPELTALTDLVSFNTAAASPQTSAQSVAVQNTGGGTIAFTSVTCGASFCVVPSAVPSPIGGGATANISVQANPAGLNAGFYFTELTIVSSAGTVTVPVTLLIQASPSLVLSPSGDEFSQPAGVAAAQPDTQFLVNISGAPSASSSVSFTAQIVSVSPWLSLSTTSGSSTSSNPGTVIYKINSNASSLAAGAYYATIRITASGVLNSPQDFQVVLNVQAATAPQAPSPTPAGLIFSGTVSSVIPPQQTVLYASTSGAVAYQASATTSDGANWLAVSPATGTTSGANPASVNITANPAGLAPGIYHGTVSYSLAAAAVPAVNVTLIVETTPASFRTPGEPGPLATTCTPSKLVPTSTGLVSDFSNAAAWPTPLQIQLSNDCGAPVTNGQVVTTFSNGDPPLVLEVQNATSGLYSATWTPRHTGSQVTVTAQASATGLTSATTQISGSIIPNSVPVINPGGTVHAFTPQTGQSLAPGTWMAVYGTNLANQLDINNVSVFPTTLIGTSVIIGGEEAPLEFVSTGQVNALIPYDLTAGQTYEVIVNNNGALSTPVPLQTGMVAPGVAAYVSGFAEAQHGADYSLITESSPAKPGEYIIIYLLGMGPTTMTVISGQPSPAGALTTNQPTVTLNGENVTNIPYSGLTPTAVGLYQINLEVPADAPNGDLTLIVTEAGMTTPAVILPVHN